MGGPSQYVACDKEVDEHPNEEKQSKEGESLQCVCVIIQRVMNKTAIAFQRPDSGKGRHYIMLGWYKYILQIQ